MCWNADNINKINASFLLQSIPLQFFLNIIHQCFIQHRVRLVYYVPLFVNRPLQKKENQVYTVGL